jgi:hypothetical protein
MKQNNGVIGGSAPLNNPEQTILINGLVRPPKKLKLYKALKLSYEPNERRRAKVLKRFGYKYDYELSSPEHIVAYNPFSKDLLYVPRGTVLNNNQQAGRRPAELQSRGHAYDNPDIQTDLLLGVGGLKQTKRFENERNALLKAKKKYDEDRTVLAGHSLSGAIINELPRDSKDTIITYNSPIIKSSGGTHYRTSGDVFSVFNNDITTLPNENKSSYNPVSNLLKAHNLENIKHQPIFI